MRIDNHHQLWIGVGIVLGLFIAPACGQQYIINTLNLIPGLVGGDGWGGVTLDAAGNLYFPSADNRIIKLTPNLVLSTVAGNGSPGCSGDGGPATEATLAGPHHVAVDSTGVYIAHAGYPTPGCTWNGYVRKVAADGTISTVVSELYHPACGSPQACNSLFWPQGVALDGAGNLYIADTGHNWILRGPSSGFGPVMAEDGWPLPWVVAGDRTLGSAGYADGAALSALFYNPMRLAMDATGNFYIADTYNHRIRKLTPGGYVSTVAGNGTAGFSGDGGPATGASLSRPADVAFDAAGNLYIADLDNARIRKVTPAGIISTIAGNGDPNKSYDGDGGLATSASLCGPSGIAVNNSLRIIFFVDSCGPAIRVLTLPPTTTTVTGITPEPSVAGQPYTVSFTVSSEFGVVAAAGNVTVSDGSQTCTALVADGGCMLTSLTAGAKTITATYAGDDHFSGSTSLGVSHTVTEASPAAPSNVDAVVVVNVNKRNTVYTGTVTWQDNSNNETGFLIRRFSNALGPCIVEAVATVGADTTSYTDAAANATTCGYGVASTNAGGRSVYVDDTNIMSTTAPSAPSNVNAVMTTSTKGKNIVYSATITWVNTATNASNFLVRRYITSGSGCVIDTGFGTAVLAANKGTTYTDSKASAPTCAYAVAAANSGGVSAFVGDSDLTTGITPF